MTNSEPTPAAGDHAAAEGPSSTGGWRSRRVRTGAGAAAAAVLVSGAYLFLGTPDSPLGVTTAAPPASTASAGSPTPRPAPTATPSSLPPSAKERVAAARATAARDRVKVAHPVKPKQDAAAMAAADNAQETTTGSPNDPHGTMRIVTAHGDLTGQRELAWIAGGVTTHGDVDCSQTFKLDNEQAPKERPNLLVCWRTSAERSVVAITAVVDGKPSVDRSTAAINEKWRSLR